MHDTLISLVFFNDDVLKNNYYKRFYKNPRKWMNKYPNIQKYLNDRYNDSDSLLETLYRIHYKIEKKPKCKTCGKSLTFYNTSKKQREKFTINKCFQTYCSISCEMKDKEIMDKHNDSCINKYGSVNNTVKQQNTCLEKYGVNTVLKLDVIKEKIKNTCMTKYSVPVASKSKQVKEKMKNTCIERYNKKSSLCLDECRDKRKSVSSLQKEYNTKKKNNSFNKSIVEDKSYILLTNKYPDTIRQYKSSEYPFSCDFYIPSINTYIECNYHWTHGGFPYIETEQRCIDKLNKWKQGNSKFYDNAIYTWTDLDVRKRNIAKQNNLNYIEFWNIDKLEEWVNKNINK